MPDCHFLSDEFVGLWKSGEKREKKYDQKWKTFFTVAHRGYESEIKNIDNNCPLRRSEYYIEDDDDEDDYRDDKKAKERNLKNFRRKWRPPVEIADKSTLQKYIRSSEIQDRILLAKFVEDECENEVNQMWNLLISFESQFRWKKCWKKRFVPEKMYNYALRTPSIPETLYKNIIDYNSELKDEDIFFQEVVNIYEQLYSDVKSNFIETPDKTRVEKKMIELKGEDAKKHNNQVFLRAAKQFNRFIRKIQKNFVPLKIEALCKKRGAIYMVAGMVTDVGNILHDAISKYIQYVNSKIEAYRDRLRILSYQTNFVE